MFLSQPHAEGFMAAMTKHSLAASHMFMSVLTTVFIPMFIPVFILAFMLAGCTVTPSTSNFGTSKINGPEYIDGMGYKFNWDNGNAALLSAPSEIKNEALGICMEQGYTTTYMSSVSFSSGLVTGYFNCRGTGGN